MEREFHSSLSAARNSQQRKRSKLDGAHPPEDHHHRSKTDTSKYYIGNAWMHIYNTIQYTYILTVTYISRTNKHTYTHTSLSSIVKPR
jgi:hypothetical protein